MCCALDDTGKIEQLQLASRADRGLAPHELMRVYAARPFALRLEAAQAHGRQRQSALQPARLRLHYSKRKHRALVTNDSVIISTALLD
jgi:hypothetical protein